MDLLIGRVGGVCILTLHWPRAGFMIGMPIPNKCAESVVAVFDGLYAELGRELFTRLFPVILTDRGTEFSYPSRIEECEDGTKRKRESCVGLKAERRGGVSETNPDKHGSSTSSAANGLRRGRLAIDGLLSMRPAARDSGLSRPNASPAAKPRQSRTDTVETAG